METKKFLDIEKLIAKKNPKLLNRLPIFLLNYLKRILHVDEINSFIDKNKDKKNNDWCEEVIKYLNIKVEIKNIENIPKKGRIVIAMNHPFGGMDAMILITGLKGHREDLKFIVNDWLLNLENIKDMFVGINKKGKERRLIGEKILKLFESKNAVCIFPAGLVSRKKNGEIKDLIWKKTFVSYSKKFNRTIIPVYIDGKLSNFFYRLANLRKFFRIKSNIEMLYLPNELFKQRNQNMRFIVGKPISESFFQKNKNENEIAQLIKEKVYQLKNEL